MGDSVSFGKLRPKKSHLLRGTGGLGAEIADVRDDVDQALVTLESGVGVPTINDVASDRIGTSGPLLQGLSDEQDTILTLTGTNLDAGLGYDTLSDDGAAADSMLRFTALTPGKSNIKVALTHDADHGAVNPAIAITTDGAFTVITFTYDGEEAGTSEAQDFRTSLQAHAVAGRLICIDFNGEAGTGVHTHTEGFTATALSGANQSRTGKDAIVSIAGIPATLLEGHCAAAYADVTALPTATEIRVLATAGGVWNAILAAGQEGRQRIVEVTIDGYLNSLPMYVVDSN